MRNPKISICIPAYEMGGRGAEFLSEALGSILAQNFKDFEVIVSDQSNNAAVRDVCREWADSFKIVHIWNREGKRQAAANINRAIDEARGAIVKILFQDDLIWDQTALSKIYMALSENGPDWLLCGSCITRDGHTIDRTMVPKLSEKLHFGKNTVSSPSVLAFKRACDERFDENLVWLMDVDFYKRIWDARGLPIILPDTLIANRIHDAQVSAGVDRKLQAHELDYMWKMHSSRKSIKSVSEYLKRRIKTIFST